MKTRLFCGVLALAAFALALTFLGPLLDPGHALASVHPAASIAMAGLIGVPPAFPAHLRKSEMPSVSVPALIRPRPSGLIGSVRNDAQNFERLLAEVKSSLKDVTDSVKQTAEQALKQAKETGAVTEEIKQTADKALSDQARLQQAHDKLTEKVEQLATRNTDLEQIMASRRAGGREDAKSLGQMVTEHEKVKAFAERGGDGQVRVSVQNAITTSAGSAGALIAPQRDAEIVGLPRRQLFIRQLLQVGETTSNMIEYARQVARTIGAAATAETAQKPESNLTWEPDNAPVRTIAHWIPVSRQAMDDIPQLASEINGELRYGLDYVEEAELLKGDGTGQHLHGLVPQATPYANPGVTVTNPTKVDVLRLALLQASLAEYSADGIVLNPIDWADIELTKDSERRYIFASVVQMLGPQLWGRPVISTKAMDADDFLVGAFRMAAKIWDRMDTEVLISSEDRDNFIKNMLTVRAEKRLALAVKRPGALVTGDFTTALTP